LVGFIQDLNRSSDSQHTDSLIKDAEQLDQVTCEQEAGEVGGKW
jgi:hypothetical protein